MHKTLPFGELFEPVRVRLETGEVVKVRAIVAVCEDCCEVGMSEEKRQKQKQLLREDYAKCVEFLSQREKSQTPIDFSEFRELVQARVFSIPYRNDKEPIFVGTAWYGSSFVLLSFYLLEKSQLYST